ncbi:MAG: dihydropteroate synthase [Cytophagales bacterium]|nr:MAG: dihydropteroate synthase [Cytophagales bacterium]
MHTLLLKNQLISLAKPRIMGIVNLTPDSFYAGSRYQTQEIILKQVEKMLQEGATFIDIGAYSSRPQATHITLQEEQERLLPAIEIIIKYFPEALLSVDTFRATIAEEALQRGAACINDISGGEADPEMFNTIARWQVPYILMHMRGTPQTMTQFTDYEDIIKEVYRYFQEKITLLHSLKVKDIVIDLGFGFAKNVSQNFQLLKNLPIFQPLNLPILVGVSRKSMVYKTLQTTPDFALNGTTALHSWALMQGANILRVHDVKEANEVIELWERLQNS